MLSTFDPPAYEGSPAAKLDALRAELRAQALDVYIIPHADEYRNEFLASYAERLAWLTHYTGSIGMGIVTSSEALLFTPRWYEAQAKEQTGGDCVSVRNLSDASPESWLSSHLTAGMCVGIDPHLHLQAEVKAYGDLCAKTGARLCFLRDNLIDRIWADQPARPKAKIVSHPLCYAGVSSIEKRRDIAQALKEKNCTAMIIAAVDSIAWLLNVRGGDLPVTPLPFSRLILNSSGEAAFFIDRVKESDGLKEALGPEVQLRPLAEFEDALAALGAAKARVSVDMTTTPYFIIDILTRSGADLIDAPDPCKIPKALKNEAEIDGARRAHLLDGIALTKFLAWLDRSISAGVDVDEYGAAMRLAEFRRASPEIRDLSFASISAAGPHSAMPHYVPTPQSSRRLRPGDLYMIDSGGQYPAGTTDVTRTIAIGAPTAEMRDRFTRVLKGHIALARANFPLGTTGYRLDILARLAMWEAGLDYDHGTGHGVGSYLCVHEGPHNIGPKSKDAPPLQAGMLATIEPGYYKPGAYGMRIENVALIEEAPAPAGAERPMLRFGVLTLAPVDKSLIVTSMLTQEERGWLNTYHARVACELAPHLTEAESSWLARACEALV